jgi:acetolactate synthase-1/2/3 large subunit
MTEAFMTGNEPLTGADLLVRELQARGVPFVSVLCGNGLDPFLATATRAGLRLVDTRNEQAASYLADAYARLSGCVGVCAVSSGVAHVNALAGVLNAHFDGAPVLLITGASPSVYLGRGVFQDLDHVALAKPICKHAELVTRPERIPQAIHEAFGAATSGRPGPVHLNIPVDVLGAKAGRGCKSPFSVRGEATMRAAGDAAHVADAARVLAESQRPVIVAGSGLFYADGGQALQDFAERASIPVVTPIWDRGVFAKQSDVFLGVVGAATGEPQLLAQADAIVLAGTRVDYRVQFLDSPPLSPEMRTIRIDVDPVELYQGIEPDVPILADPGTAFAQLGELWARSGYAPHGEWLSEARREHQAFYAHWTTPPALGSDKMTGAHIIEALRSVITEDTIFLIDGGSIGQWAHMTLCRDRYPAHWLTCGASGVVGWGVPGAMAARLTFPDQPVVLLTGDGAIGFAIAEFESAARQDLPFVAVLADDRAWGIVVSGQLASFGRTAASELSAVDYAQVAEGLGARGVGVSGSDDLAQAIREGIDSGRPILIHVPIIRQGPEEMLG